MNLYLVSIILSKIKLICLLEFQWIWIFKQLLTVVKDVIQIAAIGAGLRSQMLFKLLQQGQDHFSKFAHCFEI